MLAAYPTLPGVSVRYPLKSTERDSDNKAEAEAVRIIIGSRSWDSRAGGTV
jgi:hypothetical protein